MWKEKQKELPSKENLISLSPAELDRIVSEKVKAQVEHSIHQVAEGFSGPLPHPDHAKEYERLLPGVFNRIVTMAETEQKMQLDSIRRAQVLTFVLKLIGQGIFGFISLASIATGVWLVYIGKDATGIAALFTGLATLVSSAWYRRGKQEKQ